MRRLVFIGLAAAVGLLAINYFLEIVPYINIFINDRILPVLHFWNTAQPDVSSSRFTIWTQYTEILRTQPAWRWLIGYGYHDFIELLGVVEWINGPPNAVGSVLLVGRSPHNQFFYALVAAGIPGLLSLVGALSSALVVAARKIRQQVGMMALGSLVIVVVTMLFADAFTMVAPLKIAFVYVGFCCAFGKNREESNGEGQRRHPNTDNAQ